MTSSSRRGLLVNEVGPCIALASHYADGTHNVIGLAHVDAAHFANDADIRQFVARTIAQYRARVGQRFTLDNLHFSLLLGRSSHHLGTPLNRPSVLQRSLGEAGVTVTTRAFPDQTLLVMIDPGGQTSFLCTDGGSQSDKLAALAFVGRHRNLARDDQIGALCTLRRGEDLCAIAYLDADLEVPPLPA